MIAEINLDDVADAIADAAIARCDSLTDAASSLMCACFYVLHDAMGQQRAIECLGEMAKGVGDRFKN